jgi:hypothetical protein
MPRALGQWMDLTRAEKGGRSSAVLVPGWAKYFKCSPSVEAHLHSYALAWEQNPTPSVRDPTVPEGVPTDMYIWPESRPAKSKTPAKTAGQTPKPTKRSPVSSGTGEIQPADDSVKRRRLDVGAESDGKGKGADTEMQDVIEAFAYDWFDDSGLGCHHYLDSRHWKSFLEI